MFKKATLFFIILCLVIHSPNAFACNTDLTYKLEVSDLTNLKMTIYNNATVYNNNGVNISRGILDGAELWDYSGPFYVNIDFSQYTYSNNASYDLYFLIGEYGSNYSAGCIRYSSNGTILGTYLNENEETTSNWNYCIVRIHTDYQDNQDLTEEAAFRALGAHETGHALGLEHCYNIQHEAIMYQYPVYGYLNYAHVSEPSITDRELLAELYDIIPNI